MKKSIQALLLMALGAGAATSWGVSDYEGRLRLINAEHAEARAAVDVEDEAMREKEAALRKAETEAKLSTSEKARLDAKIQAAKDAEKALANKESENALANDRAQAENAAKDAQIKAMMEMLEQQKKQAKRGQEAEIQAAEDRLEQKRRELKAE